MDSSYLYLSADVPTTRRAQFARTGKIVSVERGHDVAMLHLERPVEYGLTFGDVLISRESDGGGRVGTYQTRAVATLATTRCDIAISGAGVGAVEVGEWLWSEMMP